MDEFAQDAEDLQKGGFRPDPKPPTGTRHRSTCPICRSCRQTYFKIEYLKWTPLNILGPKFNATKEELEAHIKIFKLENRRAANRRAMLAAIIDYGLQNLDNMGLKGRDIINAIQWLDKLDGLVIDRKEINGPPTVNILAIPRPGGVLNKASEVQDELAKSGPVVASYPRLKAPEEPKREFAFDTGKKEGTNEG